MNVHKLIVKGVKEQLFINEYLVLPDFGGFVLKKSPAHFSASGALILPPAKSISFNAQLKQNDGILAHWLQSELKCDASQAIGYLKDFAGYCTSLLNNRGRLTLEDIGFFYLDFENNICFEPQQQTNFLTDSFGLTPVSIKEIEAEIIKKAETVFEDRTIAVETITPVQKRKLRDYRRLAIAAVSGVVLLSSILFIVSNNKIGGKLHSSVFGNEAKSVYSPVNYSDLNIKSLAIEKQDYVADANGIAAIELDNNKTISVKAIDIELKTPTKTSHVKRTFSSHKKFQIVLGCFSILNNANKMVKKLSQQNISAEVAGQNEKGLYIVSGGGFDSKDEAVSQLVRVKDLYPNAWIKKAE